LRRDLRFLSLSPCLNATWQDSSREERRVPSETRIDSAKKVDDCVAEVFPYNSEVETFPDDPKIDDGALGSLNVKETGK